MFCKKCGVEIPDGSLFCNVCGANQNESEEVKVPVEKKKNFKPFIIVGAVVVVAAIVLAIVLGGGSKGERIQFHSFSFNLPYTKEELQKKGYTCADVEQNDDIGQWVANKDNAAYFYVGWGGWQMEEDYDFLDEATEYKKELTDSGSEVFVIKQSGMDGFYNCFDSKYNQEVHDDPYTMWQCYVYDSKNFILYNFEMLSYDPLLASKDVMQKMVKSISIK